MIGNYTKDFVKDYISTHKKDKDIFCDEKKIITALNAKNVDEPGGFFDLYVKDKPFNKQWISFILSIIDNNFKLTGQKTILNQLFKYINHGNFIDDNDILTSLLNNVSGHGEHRDSINWFRKNIENGFVITQDFRDSLTDWCMFYDEMECIYFEKTGKREPWQNQKFIDKLYKTSGYVVKTFIEKHVGNNQKNIDKFIQLSEAIIKKFWLKASYSYMREQEKEFIIFMLQNNTYYNEGILGVFLIEIFNDYDIDNLNVDIGQLIENKLNNINKLFDINKLGGLLEEYAITLKNQQIIKVLHNLYTLKVTKFVKLSFNKILELYNTELYNNNYYEIPFIEYIYGKQLTQEDYMKLLMINNFSDKVMTYLGDKLLNDLELSNKIFNLALQTHNDDIISHFIDQKYNITQDIILKTDPSNLYIYKENKIFMTKETVHKYYRKYHNNITLDTLLTLSEYNNHPEDFKQIQQDIELNYLEKLISDDEKFLVLIKELNENKPIITLDMIVYLATDKNKNILYDYYKNNN